MCLLLFNVCNDDIKKWKLIKERWWDDDWQLKVKKTKENLPECHFGNEKPQIVCPGIDIVL
jgi:hypothetical protein